jgi:hypothetical protein
MRHFKKNLVSKNSPTSHGVSFPEQELENINRCFEEQFSQLYPISMEDKTFQTYGHIFADEILLIVTLISDKNAKSPVSIFISKEVSNQLTEDENSAKKAIETMVELAGIFFDDVLSHKDWNNYTHAWAEEDYKNSTYFIKTTRENIELTLQANQLLGDDFDADIENDEIIH